MATELVFEADLGADLAVAAWTEPVAIISMPKVMAAARRLERQSKFIGVPVVRKGETVEVIGAKPG